MTREELLTGIEEQDFPYDYLANAVYRVISLHNPDAGFCSHCSMCLDMDTVYPCPTIQVIEKELTLGARPL